MIDLDLHVFVLPAPTGTVHICVDLHMYMYMYIDLPWFKQFKFLRNQGFEAARVLIFKHYLGFGTPSLLASPRFKGAWTPTVFKN